MPRSRDDPLYAMLPSKEGEYSFDRLSQAKTDVYRGDAISREIELR